MRVDGYDAIVEAALDAARQLGLYAIVRVQDVAERRLVIGGGVRRSAERRTGIGLHAFTADGSVGFASTDDLSPSGIREAVEHASGLAEVARSEDGERTLAPFGLEGEGRRILPSAYQPLAEADEATHVRALGQARERAISKLPGLQLRTLHQIVDEQWRIARSDGTDVSFATPRATLRHDLSGRIGGTTVRCSAAIGGVDAESTLAGPAPDVLSRRAAVAARQLADTAEAPPPPLGPCRLVLDYHLAKGLAHEAVGHLCESDVDTSVLMRHGRLRVGERLARSTVSVVDGPLAGDFADQPVSANGIPRQTVHLVQDGVLVGGLGDLFSAERAGLTIAGACRAASFRDRPTPRMTNTRIVVSDAAPLAVDPEDLTPELVAETIRTLGLLDARRPTLYLTGYRGGQAHPRRGDFVFAVDAVYELSEGAAPRRGAAFSGLAERALAALLAGVGPLRTDSIGYCGKDGSNVSSSGGSHALLVLEADPDLVVAAAP